jgi:hypothetical protein
MNVAGLWPAIRSMFSEFLGDDDSAPPYLPDDFPEAVKPVAVLGVHRLIDYQGPGYAQLYVDRLRRFVGRRDFDDATFNELARLMAARMAYEDPIQMARSKLAEFETGAAGSSADHIRKLRFDELVSSLPDRVADPILSGLEYVGWLHLNIPMRFSTASRFGIRRLKIEASLQRWRLFSVRYATERVWVERWLHMIDRSLTKQPAAAAQIVQTATMIQGYGDSYRQGLLDWHLIIDNVVKPTFDGKLNVQDLAGAIAEARDSALADPRQAALKRKIAEIRARVSGPVG